MRRRLNWRVMLLKIALIATIAIAGFGRAVMELWNLVVPDVFGLHAISFWQAVGLMALSWILFGGLGMFRGRPMDWRHRMAERMEQMTPEERERFRQGMKRGCGGGPEASAAAAE